MPLRLPSTSTPWLTCLLAVQIAGLLHTVWFFNAYGYLPAPFVYDKSDTFMDFYHPLYWASDDGRYTVWQSVYPPLNFLLLKSVHLLILGGERFSDGFSIRSTFPELAWLIVAMALGSAFIAFRVGPFRGLASRHQFLLFFFFVLSPPFLFTVERGNLIILALPFLALALSRGGWTRMVCIAILINLKPYFALLTLVYIAQRRFDYFILTGLLACFIFLTTGLLLDPNFPIFFANLLGFSKSGTVFSGREVLAMPSSMSAFSYVANLVSVRQIELSTNLKIMSSVAQILNYINLSTVLFFASILIIKSETVTSDFILLGAMLLITNGFVKGGGYTLIGLIYILALPLTDTLSRVYYRLACIIFLPLDLVSLSAEAMPPQSVYLSNQTIPIEFSLGLGSIARPAIDFLLILVTILMIMNHRNGLAKIA